MRLDGVEVQNSLVERLLNNRLQNRPTMLVGPAGSGKTLLAKRLALGGVFRAPHHTISAQGLVGKVNDTSRCEVVLAHQGILFLDEFPEFRRSVVDQLRGSLLHGDIKVASPVNPEPQPVRVWILAAMDECLCGRTGDKCRCDREHLRRYQDRAVGYRYGFDFDVIHLESTVENGQINIQMVTK